MRDTLSDSYSEAVGSAARCSPATCLSSKATTGWSDWIHGELWITCRGLAYRNGNLGKTLLNIFRRDVNGRQRPCTELLDPTRPDHAELAIDSGSVLAYDCRAGILNSRLRVTQVDGEVSQFLWIRNERSSELAGQLVGAKS